MVVFGKGGVGVIMMVVCIGGVFWECCLENVIVIDVVLSFGILVDCIDELLLGDYVVIINDIDV